MNLTRRKITQLAGGAALLFGAIAPQGAAAATAAEITRDVQEAERRLRGMDNAAPLFANAQAVLIFPRIVQGGFIVGGQYGEGAMLRRGTTSGFFRIVGASFGFQAGAQTQGLAMFFMTEEALRQLDRADGWELGTGPSVVALDRGLQANVTTTTLTEPVYAITFAQQGLMAALTLNGTKITRFTPG